MPDIVYVSITGLQLRHFWNAPKFWRHAAASMAQARSAAGCLSAETRTINGVHHTRSVWTSRDAMRAYLHSGPHLKAIRLFGRIATGRTFGFETSDVPDWHDVHRIWRDHGQTV